jgi:peptide/nickel transport system permease protein
MIAYLLQRLAAFVATLAVASLVVFAVLEILPGRPAEVMLGDTATAESIAALEARLGLDRRRRAIWSGSAACCAARAWPATPTTRRPSS